MAEHHDSYQGQHRLWHVLADPASDRRIKLSEPREGVLWFDRRCFRAEEPLLAELAGLGMTHIPAVHPADGGDPRSEQPLYVQDFVDGTSLADVAPQGTPLTARHLDDIEDRFRQLAAVDMDDVRTERTCAEGERARNLDTGTFFGALIAFTRERAHLEHRERYGPLFDALGVPRDALGPGSRLANETKALAPRPFCLLHGDLHRANFIVDRTDGRLWTIDWELAMLGDPLYDLATHLHLMRYPAPQEREMKDRWLRATSSVLPGADTGWREDLPRYLAYKRAQSVFTDVVRQAQKLATAGPDGRATLLEATARTVHTLLRQAADVLDPAYVPEPADVVAAYRRHVLSAAPAPPAAADGPRDGAATRRGGRGAASPRARSGSG